MWPAPKGGGFVRVPGVMWSSFSFLSRLVLPSRVSSAAWFRTLTRIFKTCSA